MSTTRSSSEEPLQAYSVLSSSSGGPRSQAPLSVILLNRSSWLFRAEVLEELVALGFSDIISVEEFPLKLDAEALVEGLPQVRFLVTPKSLSPGERINTAAEETFADRFMVLWDDQKLPENLTPSKLLSLFLSSSEICLVPEMYGSDGEEIPSRTVPARQSGRFRILTLPSEDEGEDVLFPFDFTGIYDRLRFLQSGGFDVRIANPFWQKADWGTRVRLWGDCIGQRKAFHVEFRSALPVEDVSHDGSYKLFYLKNLALRFNGEAGELPLRRFASFWFRSGLTFWQAWKVFFRVRSWVGENRYRFRTDPRVLVELWGQ